MQKTIYISTPEIWASIIKMSGEKSISRYLVDLHEDNVLRQQLAWEKQAAIQEEIDILSGIPEKILKPGDNERPTTATEVKLEDN